MANSLHIDEKEIKLAYKYGKSLITLVQEYGFATVADSLGMSKDLLLDALGTEGGKFKATAGKKNTAPHGEGILKTLFGKMKKGVGSKPEKDKDMADPNMKITINVDQSAISKIVEEEMALLNTGMLNKMLKAGYSSGGKVKAQPKPTIDISKIPNISKKTASYGGYLGDGGMVPPELAAKVASDTAFLLNEAEFKAAMLSGKGSTASEKPPLEELFDQIIVRLGVGGMIRVQFWFMGKKVKEEAIAPTYTSMGDVKYTLNKNGSIEI